MSKKQWIVIGVVIVFVFMIVGGLLRWGERVYRASSGQRGWSIGASVYQMLGWGADAYQKDWSYTCATGQAGTSPSNACHC